MVQMEQVLQIPFTAVVDIYPYTLRTTQRGRVAMMKDVSIMAATLY